MDKGLLELCTKDGALGGYPQVLTIFGAIYRKDIFEKYGIQVPTTFEEFESTLQVLKDNGVIPFAIGGKTGWHVIRFIDMLVEMYAGAEMHDKMIALEETWNQEAVIKAFAKLKEWSDKGYFPEGFITSDPNDARLMLYNGLAAITLDGAPIIQMIQKNGADINQFGSFRIPNNETPDRMMTYPTLVQFNANLTDAQLEAAVAFIEFTLSEDAAVKDRRAYPLPAVGLEFPETTPIIVPLQHAYEKLGGFTTGDHAFDPVITNAFYQAQESVIGGVMTPEQAAQFLQENIEAFKAAS